MVEPIKPITPPAEPIKPQEPAPAPKPVQAPVAKPPVTPPPVAQKPGVPGAPPKEEGKDNMVPITALHEERDKRQQLQIELDAMKKVAGSNMLFDINGNPVATQAPAQVQPEQQRYKEELDKLWETDPRKAVQSEIYAAMTWRDQQDSAFDSQEMEVASKYPDYNNYRPEIRRYVRTLPLEQRAKDGVAELAYYVVKGQKVDSIIAKSKEELEAEWKIKQASGEGAQALPSGAVSTPPSPEGAVTLSEDQKVAAAAMGLTEEQYISQMKRV